MRVSSDAERIICLLEDLSGRRAQFVAETQRLRSQRCTHIPVILIAGPSIISAGSIPRKIFIQTIAGSFHILPASVTLISRGKLGGGVTNSQHPKERVGSSLAVLAFQTDLYLFKEAAAIKGTCG